MGGLGEGGRRWGILLVGFGGGSMVGRDVLVREGGGMMR